MTARVVPGQSDLNLDGSALLKVDKDDHGWPQTYSCPQLVEDNYVTPISVSFYYDLMSLSSEDATTARQYFESLLIQSVANEFGLADGSACISPSEIHILYPVMLNSLPADEPNTNLEKCMDLSPDSAHTCISYLGTITGYVAGVDDTTELVQFIASAIQNGTAVEGTTLEAAFLGTHMENDDARDALKADSVNAQQPESTTIQNQAFTSVGVVLTVALSIVFAGFLLVIWRMRKRRQQQWREEVVMATRSNEMGTIDHTNEVPHRYRTDGALDGEDIVSVNSFPDHRDKYSLDVGDYMKSKLFAVHGETTPSRRKFPAAPPSESSEDDSWAQTEATLASLEVRLSKVQVNETGEI